MELLSKLLIFLNITLVVMYIFNPIKRNLDSSDKGQIIRLYDIFLIGPLMIYIGLKTTNVDNFIASFIAGLGLGTLFYNLQNFIATLLPIAYYNKFVTNDVYYIIIVLIITLGILYYKENYQIKDCDKENIKKLK